MVRKKDEDDLDDEDIVEDEVDDDIDDELEDDLEESLEEDEDEDEDEVVSDEDTEADDNEPEEAIAEENENEPNDRMSGLAADVPVQVVAVLGKRSFTMKDLMNFHMGQVVDLYRPANETVDLVVGGKLIAKGELVSIDGKLGVKIVKLI